MEDYYSLLFILPTASQEEIRAAHNKLALKLHPDHNKGERFFTECLQKINEAYEVLSDPESRRRYDEKRSHQHMGERPKANNNSGDENEFLDENEMFYQMLEKEVREYIRLNEDMRVMEGAIESSKSYLSSISEKQTSADKEIDRLNALLKTKLAARFYGKQGGNKATLHLVVTVLSVLLGIVLIMVGCNG